MPDVTNPGFSRALRAITLVARERGYTVIVLNTSGSPETARECIEHVMALRVDGVIIALTWDLARAEIVELLKSRGIQAVGLAGSRRLEGIDTFMWDETDAGYRLARYLLRLGHSEIAFLGPRGSESAKRRLQGIEKALLEAGHSPGAARVLHTADYSAQAAYDSVLEAIGSAVPFTALITFNDSFTTGALAALADQGLRVPEHISVATFGQDHTAFSRPQITSMTYDEDSVSARAVGRLIDRIEGTYGEEPKCELAPLSFVVRTSCQALGASGVPNCRS